MLKNIWNKCVNYETVSYIICGFLTTGVDFVSYGIFRKMEMGVGLSQALSWFAAVLFAYVVNKLVVFQSFDFHPLHLIKEAGAFVAARAVSGAITWLLMVVMVRLGDGRGFLYELFCKFMASLVNMVLNYIFSKVWIFKKKPEKR
jgi:putative flippase GtrA